MPAPKKNAVTAIKSLGSLIGPGKKAADIKAAKKAAEATLKNAGKAGSPLTAKVVVGPKTRAKMAEGKFGGKVNATKPPVVKAQPNPNVKVRPSVTRDPFAGMNKPKKKK